MKIPTTFLICTTFLCLTAARADAQCAFDAPSKAKGVKMSMVRSFPGCPSITIVAPNTLTKASVPACWPPFAHSLNTFGTKGKCDVKVSSKLESPCQSGSGIPCTNISFKAKCSDITESDGVTPITSGVWALAAILRWTFDDNDFGDMTVIDFPLQIAFDPPNAGKLKLKADTNSLLANLFGPGTELPGCTSTNQIQLAIKDESGNTFAVPGYSTR